MTFLRAIFGLAVLVAACSAPPPVIPTKDLEHPTDLTMVCLAQVGPLTSGGTTVLSGQPMDVCHTRDVADPPVTSNGQRTLGTFAFITSPGRDELAVADMDRSHLVDLSPEASGYGMLPVGGDPEAVASSQDSCWVATTNRTSCDLTLLDPARLLTATFSTSTSAAAPATGSGDASRRLVIRTPAGRVLRAEPGEIAFLPPMSSSQVCQGDVMPRAVVTFPTCDMVALLDFSFANSDATIASAYYVRPDLPGGYLSAGSEPACPTDCGAPEVDAGGAEAVNGGATEGAGVDGGATEGAGIDGGAGRQESAWYLQPLALVPDGSRVYVGSLMDTAITSLDIDAAGLRNPIRSELAENPVGVTRLRLAVDPYRTSTVVHADGSTGIVQGQFLQNRGRFLYAFTRDDSVRVLEVSQATPVECDVNIIATPDQKAQGCLPVGTPHRRPLAQGPGIHIPIPVFASPDNPSPLPRDVAFADLQPAASDSNIQSLSGQFGFLIGSNGQVYVLNLAPIGEDGTSLASDGTTVTATATNSFRETRDVGKWAKTPLAITIAPQHAVLVSDQAFATTATYSALDGPLIKSFSPDNGITTNWLDYPDRDTLVSRSWDVIWEGALPQATRASGIVRSATDGSAGILDDAGADFCSSGVLPGDVLMFSGCTQDIDCQPDDQFTCQVAVSGARGMCLPRDGTVSAALIEHCAQFMGSRMRYEIAQATPTSLRLQLKLDEVPKTALNPCKQDSDCRPDADHESLSIGNPDGGGRRAFECIEVRPQDRRCVQRCDKDSDCRAGHVCESVPWTSLGDDKVNGLLCVEAPPIDPRCFPQPMTAYSVRAGHGFMVYGSSMPSLSTARVSPDGTCQPQVPADPSLVARIPLSAPVCPDSFFSPLTDPASSAKFVQQLSAQSGSNPCLYQGAQPDGNTAASSDAGPSGDPHIRAFFQNPQIRFVMTNLDEYAGDLLDLHFELQYGFVPWTVQIPSYEVMMTMGTRIITGPTQTPESPVRRNPPTGNISYPYLYVVDQGRSALTPGSKGQILRINPRSGSNEISYFDTTLSGGTPFQIQ